MARSAFLITVTGQVQGVGFRAFILRRATALGLDGWVRNRRDGSVEITVIGETTAVDALLEQAAEGPAGAKIEEVALRGATDDGTTGFHQRPTA